MDKIEALNHRIKALGIAQADWQKWSKEVLQIENYLNREIDNVSRSCNYVLSALQLLQDNSSSAIQSLRNLNDCWESLRTEAEGLDGVYFEENYLCLDDNFGHTDYIHFTSSIEEIRKFFEKALAAQKGQENNHKKSDVER